MKSLSVVICGSAGIIICGLMLLWSGQPSIHRVEIGDGSHGREAATTHSDFVPKGRNESLVGSAKTLAPKDIFFNESLEFGSRFDELMSRARAGALDANHYALQIASLCGTWTNPAPLWEGMTAEAHRSARRITEKCKSVLASPDFAPMFEFSRSNPRDVYNQLIRATITNRFVEQGGDAAVASAVNALRERPDGTTVGTVLEVLGNLGLGDSLTSSIVAAGSRYDPERRNGLLSYALNWVACDFGRSCGPDSADVLMLCATGNFCKPGAGLQEIYRDLMLSKSEMDEVQNLVNALEYVPAA